MRTLRLPHQGLQFRDVAGRGRILVLPAAQARPAPRHRETIVCNTMIHPSRIAATQAANQILDYVLDPRNARIDPHKLYEVLELGVPDGQQLRVIKQMFRKQARNNWRRKNFPEAGVWKLTEKEAIRLVARIKDHPYRKALLRNPFTPLDLLPKLVELDGQPRLSPWRETTEPMDPAMLGALSRRRSIDQIEVTRFGKRTPEQSAALCKALVQAARAQESWPERSLHVGWHLTLQDAIQIRHALNAWSRFGINSTLLAQIELGKTDAQHPFHQAAQCTWLADALTEVRNTIHGLPHLEDEATFNAVTASLHGAVQPGAWLALAAANPHHGSDYLAANAAAFKDHLRQLPVACLGPLLADVPAALQHLTKYNDDFLETLFYHDLVHPKAIASLPPEQLLELMRLPALKAGWPNPGAPKET
jgi:hypothetical protein